MKECCRKYLDEQFGDEDIVAEIYEEFAKSAREKTAEAKAALASKDWQRLDSTAHALKGNALAVGDAETVETAVALRSAAKLQDAADAERLVAALESLNAAL